MSNHNPDKPHGSVDGIKDIGGLILDARARVYGFEIGSKILHRTYDVIRRIVRDERQAVDIHNALRRKFMESDAANLSRRDIKEWIYRLMYVTIQEHYASGEHIRPTEIRDIPDRRLVRIVDSSNFEARTVVNQDRHRNTNLIMQMVDDILDEEEIALLLLFIREEFSFESIARIMYGDTLTDNDLADKAKELRSKMHSIRDRLHHEGETRGYDKLYGKK